MSVRRALGLPQSEAQTFHSELNYHMLPVKLELLIIVVLGRESEFSSLSEVNSAVISLVRATEEES